MKLLYVEEIIDGFYDKYANLINSHVTMFRTSRRRGRLSEARETNMNFDLNSVLQIILLSQC